MITYRILHIPSGEFVCTPPNYSYSTPVPVAFPLKLFAFFFLYFGLRRQTYLKAGQDGYITSFSREEFCIVAVNNNLIFQNQNQVPAISRKACVK